MTIVLLTVSTSEAQQAKSLSHRLYHINRTEIGPNEEAFQRGLRDLGYIEGENLVIEWRFTGAQLDRNPDVAAELVRLRKVDLHCYCRGRERSRSGKAIDEHYTHSDGE